MSSKKSVESSVVWAAGHGLFVLCALMYFGSSASFFYKTGLLCLCASLAVDVYRACLAGTSATLLAEKLFLTESSPYLFLSLALYFLSPAGVLLLPLSIYSLYGALSFARAHPAVTRTPLWKQYGAAASDQLAALHPAALDLATQLELLAMPWLLLSVLSTGLVLPMLYASFLRWQYFVSPRTRLAFASWDETILRATANPATPPFAKTGYAVFRSSLKRWVRFGTDLAARASAAAAPHQPPTTASASAANLRKSN